MTLLLATVACLPEAAMVQGALEQGSIHKEARTARQDLSKANGCVCLLLVLSSKQMKSEGRLDINHRKSVKSHFSNGNSGDFLHF